MACIACRESKVKCDGDGNEKCSSCVNKLRECRYQAVDKRKLPLRVAIELLTSRVNQLYLFVHQNGLEPPCMPQEKDAALAKVLDILGLTEFHSASPQLNAHSSSATVTERLPSDTPTLLNFPTDLGVTGDAENLIDHASMEDALCAPHPDIIQIPDSQAVPELPIVSDETTDIPLTDSYPLEDISDTPLASLDWNLEIVKCMTPPSQDFQGLLGGTSSVETLERELEGLPDPFGPPVTTSSGSPEKETRSPERIEDLIDELSDRVGTLRFGPEGQPHFYGPTSTFNLPDAPVTTKPQTHRTLDFCDNDIDPGEEAPLALDEHLLNLYFTWQDPSFHVVDREMCSLGAAFETRYHPSFVTFPKSLVEHFGDRAKALLEIELDSPSVATVQVLVIMSSHEVGNGQDTRGWLYSGMALRLAFDLALHIDLSSYVARGSITAADAGLRRTVFWAAYMVDHLVGFNLGRPFYTNMGNVTVKKPNTDTCRQEPSKWRPYACPISFGNKYESIDLVEAVSEQEVSLCEVMAPCGYFLYGSSNLSKLLLQQQNVKVVARLLDWKASLPQSLQIDLNDHATPYLPHVLLLHMQFFQNLIHSHRPWMSKDYLQPQPPVGPGHTHAREMCIQSAISIAKILVLYEKRYTLRWINVKAVSITSSAILLLLFAAVSHYPLAKNEDITAHLGTCFRALDEFSLSWQSANKVKDLLIRLQYKWELKTRARKQSRALDGDIDPPRKMSRTANSSATGHGVSRSDDGISLAHPSLRDLQPDSGLGWMLMLSGQLPADGDEDLYSSVANTAIPGVY
ncbi:hypothetical protein PENANT_c013G00053 [Penicillium antarcticum]|uniref:Zn(2)-C6 fungal-type domain-containing protein n=1 Tax=Penicillium antarcticum TaxID=416450 RepID=A0A1V6Q5E2_9EURO|nr:hypothetical protein PENANT_c013G00053 [Penicillium antarcticum]